MYIIILIIAKIKYDNGDVIIAISLITTTQVDNCNVSHKNSLSEGDTIYIHTLYTYTIYIHYLYIHTYTYVPVPPPPHKLTRNRLYGGTVNG